MVSFVLNFARKNAGTAPQTPPQIIPARPMTGSRIYEGSELKLSAKYDAPSAPIIICPSAPMFQNLSLKAAEMPSEAITRGTALRMVSLILYGVPNAPFNMDE